jgi:prepilin-type N-terminal cleavage/methylation domain-containing protein/prepilin-type processing-associated H-X9-DG protein
MTSTFGNPFGRGSTRRRSGFTLLEVLIVVGIIALLAAIVFGVLAKARESGRRVQCLNNLKTISQAILMYAQTNDNALPANAGQKLPLQDHDWVWWQSSPVNGSGFRISQINQHGIGKYVDGLSDLSPRGLSTLRCPSDSRLLNQGFLDTTPDQSGQPYPSGYPFSYVMNGLMCSGTQPDVTGFSPGPTNQLPAVRTITAIKDAANKILVYEEDRRTIDDGYGLLTPNGGATNILSIRHDGFDEGQSVNDSTTVAIGAGPTVAVQKNGERVGNVAFCDGHAAAIDRTSAHSKDHWAPDPLLWPGYP